MTHSIHIPLIKVKEGQLVSNDRKHYDPLAIEQLAVGMAHAIRTGKISPILVRPVDDHFEVVFGHRRRLAHLHIFEHGITYTTPDGDEAVIPPGEISTIKAEVHELTDRETADLMLAENTNRVDLNPIEEAEAYHLRKTRFKMSLEEIADKAGRTLEHVRNRLSLLSLIPDLQHLVRFGNLPIGHAEALTPLDANRQRIAYRIYSESKTGLTLRQFRHIINDLLAEQQSQSLFDLEQFWVEQVQKDQLPRRGKKAYVPAPTRKDLPPVKRNTRWTAADVIDQYVADLIRSGHHAEAAAIGNVYHTLVRHNYIAVPLQSAIPDTEEEYTAHEVREENRRI